MAVPDRITISKGVAHYFIQHKEVTEEEYRAIYPDLNPTGKIGMFATASSKAWPYTSTSIGCHPSDRKKFMKAMAAKGVPTEFNHEGRAIFTSRDHQRRYCQANGLVNYDETWSGKGPVDPPPPPKKRPKMGKPNQVQSKEPPVMRTETRDGKGPRRRK
jgi:hypothetical protein